MLRTYTLSFHFDKCTVAGYVHNNVDVKSEVVKTARNMNGDITWAPHLTPVSVLLK